MTTYIYETIPTDGTKPRRFEVKQSMKDKALTHAPDTGEPVRRVITGGHGFYGANAERPSPATGPCGTQCGCFGAN